MDSDVTPLCHVLCDLCVDSLSHIILFCRRRIIGSRHFASASFTVCMCRLTRVSSLDERRLIISRIVYSLFCIIMLRGSFDMFTSFC